MMENGGVGQDGKPPDMIDRETLCFSSPEPGVVIHPGDKGYHELQQRLYSTAESTAIEKLVQLKATLRQATNAKFWETATRGLAEITGAQYAFASKRIVTDDENLAVEMPPIGMPGSCLMALALYINDGLGLDQLIENFKYHAYSCPCAYMRHDKIFVIADHLDEFVIDNPNTLPVPAEAYIGIPLFEDGKCFGHFGLMWSPEGYKNRKLGWAHIELIMHALEDIIRSRMLEGKDFSKAVVDKMQCGHPKVIPHDAISVAQSLKPYARSLSHELRTPMQGVVGMLDVMYATVQDAVQEHADTRTKQVFLSLKENIEVVQDSSRRAVEAADNVVHAYDMNMGVPDTPCTPFDDEAEAQKPSANDRSDKRPDIFVAGNNMHLNLRPNKRKRELTSWEFGPATKMHILNAPEAQKHTGSASGRPLIDSASASGERIKVDNSANPYRSPKSEPSSPTFASERHIVPGLRHANLSDVLQYIINDSLRVGGRPESAIAKETDNGEIIEVQTKSPSGEELVKTIEWSVDPNVPDSLLIDERELGKMISCIVLNAIKFTEEGKILITARLSKRSRYVIINVKDTGSGIPATFHPNLFKAFAREDDSLTRQSEGLGLGLLVAKGLARKLGGDLRCVHTSTEGPNKGSDFEMRVPCTPGDVCSRAASPSHSSPSPSTRSRTPAEVEELGALPPTAAKALKSVMHEHRLEPSRTSAPPNVLLRSPNLNGSPSRRPSTPYTRRTSTKSTPTASLAARHPLNFLVVEDNKINRTILVSMLRKFGYSSIREAYDGADAVRKMTEDVQHEVDVILMDLWMPLMDGYEATERILQMGKDGSHSKVPTILAVTADVTDGALERAAKVGMKGLMTKPYKLPDLEKLIVEYCAQQRNAIAV